MAPQTLWGFRTTAYAGEAAGPLARPLVHGRERLRRRPLLGAADPDADDAALVADLVDLL